MVDWLLNHNLMLNNNKTYVMQFVLRHLNDQMEIKNENESLALLEATGFLGIIINSRLNCKDHINNTCIKLS